jgi:hypothetical protein
MGGESVSIRVSASDLAHGNSGFCKQAVTHPYFSVSSSFIALIFVIDSTNAGEVLHVRFLA